jgi:putative flippase GtrA
MACMSDIEPRATRTPRRAREQRAYRLVQAGGLSAAVAVVSLVLALAGVIGFTLPILAIVVAVVCAFLFRRAVSR